MNPEMEYKVEAGEIFAPVSSMYKLWIMEVIHKAIQYDDEYLYNHHIDFVKSVINSSEVYPKTSSKFKREVEYFLSLSHKEMYYAVHGPEALERDWKLEENAESKSTNNNTNIKPNLKLVK